MGEVYGAPGKAGLGSWAAQVRARSWLTPLMMWTPPPPCVQGAAQLGPAAVNPLLPALAAAAGSAADQFNKSLSFLIRYVSARALLVSTAAAAGRCFAARGACAPSGAPPRLPSLLRHRCRQCRTHIYTHLVLSNMLAGPRPRPADS